MAVTLSNADIVSRLKLLADIHLKADSGTTTSLTNSSLIDNQSILNHIVCFINGDNIGVDRVITSFNADTGAIGFDALDTAITNTNEVCVVSTGYLSDAAQAEIAIRNDFRNKGYNLDLFLTSSHIKETFIYKTIELICMGLMNDGTDTDAYYVQANRFRELYNAETSSLIADYDSNEDGNIDADEEMMPVGQIGFSR